MGQRDSLNMVRGRNLQALARVHWRREWDMGRVKGDPQERRCSSRRGRLGNRASWSAFLLSYFVLHSLLTGILLSWLSTFWLISKMIFPFNWHLSSPSTPNPPDSFSKTPSRTHVPLWHTDKGAVYAFNTLSGFGRRRPQRLSAGPPPWPPAGVQGRGPSVPGASSIRGRAGNRASAGRAAPATHEREAGTSAHAFPDFLCAPLYVHI